MISGVAGKRDQPVSNRRRFVILEHDHPFLHWDLLLEDSNALRSWRLLAPLKTDCWLAAEKLPDHRKIYLDYEGPVSGNRGHVHRVAAGHFESSGAVAGSVEESFRLFDYDMAQFAVCRQLASGKIQWRFTSA